MPTSSIDDLLMGEKTHVHPQTPENQAQEQVDAKQDSNPDVSHETPKAEAKPDILEPTPKAVSQDDQKADASHEETVQEDHQESDDAFDDYGNPKPKPRVYSQEEADAYANKLIRERLARLERNSGQQATPQQVQQQTQQVQAAQAGFQYDANAAGDWQQQLENFIIQTTAKQAQRQAYEVQQQALLQQQQKEKQIQEAFEQRFKARMEDFKDFTDVVGTTPLSDPMVYAMRGMKDPAAFLYAAAKRMPQEVSRIAAIPDAYAQILEMGKLEAKLTREKPTSKTPKPVARTKEDMPPAAAQKKGAPTIEQMMQDFEAQKIAKMKGRRR